MKVLKTKSTYEVLPQSAIFEKFGRELCSGTGFNPCKLFFKMIADVDNIDPVSEKCGTVYTIIAWNIDHLIDYS